MGVVNVASLNLGIGHGKIFGIVSSDFFHINYCGYRSAFPAVGLVFRVIFSEEYRTLLSSQGFELIRVSPLASFDLVAMEALWEPRKHLKKKDWRKLPGAYFE